MKKILLVSPDYQSFPLSAAFVITTLRKCGIAYDFLDLHLSDDLEARIHSGDYWGVATTGLVLDFNWICSMRVDFDPNLLPFMADAGARYIFVGLESFDDQALKAMGKNTYLTFVRLYRDKGIRYRSG